MKFHQIITSAQMVGSSEEDVNRDVRPVIGEEAVLKVLNSLVRDADFPDLANEPTEAFFKTVINQGPGGKTLKPLSEAINKHQFYEILISAAKRGEGGEKVVLSHQIRQMLLDKAKTLPTVEIGRIWA